MNQTSDRIIQFANALTGGDPDKIESMREAFKKGYAQAEKTWGGSLPEISQKTYDAVMEKFDKLAADAGLTTENNVVFSTDFPIENHVVPMPQNASMYNMVFLFRTVSGQTFYQQHLLPRA